MGDGVAANPFVIRSLDDFIVDVGKVADELNLVAEEFQITINNIESQQSPRMTDMRRVINSNATDIHAHLSRRQRNEALFFSA